MDTGNTSFDWSLIKAFLAVADAGSLSAAARQLGSSQPTLGRQIRQLEQDLGQTLFHRHPAGLALTDQGRLLIAPARRMQAAMADLELTAAGQQTGVDGSVRITASNMVSLHILPPIIARLRAAQPGISLDLVSTDATENLLFREADIALRMYRPDQLELVTRHLGDVRFGVYGARRYLDQAGRPQSANDLFDHPLIGYDRDEGIIRHMRDHGWPATRDWFALRCDTHPVNWAMLRAGVGLGFGPICIGRDDPAVELIDLGLDLPTLPVWIATHRALRHSPRISIVWQALVDGLTPYLS